MKYLPYLAVLILIGVGTGFYLWNKPHRDMEAAEADIKTSATELFAGFENDESAANDQYLDKVIQVTGQVRDYSRDDDGSLRVTLDSGNDMFGVICQMDELTEQPRESFTPGETVTMKGLCTGMLMDVVLVRCVEVK